MKLRLLVFIASCLFSICSWSWEAKVTNILHHGDVIAVSLSPDPGPLQCDYGSPYLIKLDGSQASDQLFSMVLTALATGKTVTGYGDPCASDIWAKSRPTIWRLNLKSN